jgi:aconitate decarboxylase
MGLLHAAIDAALELRSGDKAPADQIERIDIDMPEAAYGHGGWSAVRPLEPIGAQMNVAYAVPVGLLDGQVLIDQFSEKRINSDDVWNLIDRTKTHHEKAYDQLPVDERLTTRVRLKAAWRNRPDARAWSCHPEVSINPWFVGPGPRTRA